MATFVVEAFGGQPPRLKQVGGSQRYLDEGSYYVAHVAFERGPGMRGDVKIKFSLLELAAGKGDDDDFALTEEEPAKRAKIADGANRTLGVFAGANSAVKEEFESDDAEEDALELAAAMDDDEASDDEEPCGKVDGDMNLIWGASMDDQPGVKEEIEDDSESIQFEDGVLAPHCGDRTRVAPKLKRPRTVHGVFGKDQQNTAAESGDRSARLADNTDSNGEVAGTPSRGHRDSSKCVVDGCTKQAQGRSVNADEYGRTGRRCMKHGGGHRCSVEGCMKASRGSFVGADEYGGSGGRCARHGGGVRCSVEGCAKLSLGTVVVADQNGSAGNRCHRHGGRRRGQQEP